MVLCCLALCLTCPEYVIVYVLYIVLSIFLENVFPFTPPSLPSLPHSLPTEALQPGHHNAVLRCLHLVRLLHEPSQSQGEDEHAVRGGEEGGTEREGK